MKERPRAVFAIRQVHRITGAVRNVLEQAKYVREMGYRVHICAERADRKLLAENGIRWIHIPRLPIKGYVRRTFFNWCVQRYIHIIKPDLFISHGDACSDDILVIHNCAALTQECLPGSESRDKELVSFQGRVIRNSRFRYLIANSELMRQDLIKRYELDPSKVGVFYQGVDTTLFNTRNHAQLRQKGRSMLQLPNHVFAAGLITSGAFRKRNVRFFLEVAANVRSHLPEAHFVIVGKDSSPKLYRNHAQQLGLNDAVIFAPPIKNVHVYYHALDAFVYPARIEEYGRVVLEALACGIPSIIGASVGASEIMEIENVPSVLKGWDGHQWSEEIISIAKHPTKSQTHTAAGKILAEKYSQPNRSQALKELLARLEHISPSLPGDC